MDHFNWVALKKDKSRKSNGAVPTEQLGGENTKSSQAGFEGALPRQAKVKRRPNPSAKSAEKNNQKPTLQLKKNLEIKREADRMQIISGEKEGRKLMPLRAKRSANSAARRESIFNILNGGKLIDDMATVIYDLFAGSGALGLKLYHEELTFVIWLKNRLTLFQSSKKIAAN